MNNSFDKKNIKHIHLLAVCGVGMASLAGLLKEKGYHVTGTDQNVYPPMSEQLHDLGISLFQGYAAGNVPSTTDLVVIGNAISKSNEEAQEVERRGLPVLSMPQALHDFFLSGKQRFVVAGTHGKTTTTAMTAWCLEQAGRAPGFFVGGMPKNFTHSYAVGSGDWFVIEGDEYDSAYFDKGPKFLHYRPHILLLNAVEFDHADIYRDLEHVLGSFERLVSMLSSADHLVAYGDHPNVRKLGSRSVSRVTTFGLGENVDVSARNIGYKNEISFDCWIRGSCLGRVRSPLMGEHNLLNMLGVIAALHGEVLSFEELQAAFLSFQGVKKRQEILGEKKGVLVIDDFAHHPTAVAYTLEALRARYPERRIWSVFEPRSNSTRRRVFQDRFVDSFVKADVFVLSAPYQIEKIPPDERIDPALLVEQVRSRGGLAQYIPHLDDVVAFVVSEVREGDVVCFMSNGGFGGIQQKLLEALGS